ncbi:MAG TPA: site-specific integrase [Verrucomicrobiae bacterium]|nr:site-specific integrase [Verrucomicrobiae bacterium]
MIDCIGRKWPEKFREDVDQISIQDLGDFIGRIASLSDSRFNGIVTMFRATVPAAKKIRRRRLRLKERPLVNQAEFSKLLQELDGRPRSHAGLIVRFLAHTGLRINEARQVRWEHVQKDFFLLPGSVTKNDHTRVIPFVNGIRKILEALRQVAGDRTAVIPQAECKRSLRTACKLAGLHRLTHHDFRHLFTTRCIESGVDIPTVARWRGDKDGGAMLVKNYFHLLDEHSRRMAERVRI